MSHGDRVTALPPGFERHRRLAERALRRHRRRGAASSTASSSTPRSTTPPDGARLLQQLHRTHRGLRRRLDHGRLPRPGDRRRSAPRSATSRVICGLSGGVDSSVAAVLIHEAIGDQLTCVFVDTGLMRAGEAEEVVTPVPRPLQHPAGARRRGRAASSTALAGVTDPETKRKTIGRALHRGLRAHAAAKLGGAEFLAQGTLYPDVIESVVVHRRPLGHDQEPPQCRRPARAHEPEAGRAAARAVQGRGARARPRARPARPPSSAATRSRAPASPSAARARSPRRSSTSCARPTRSISTRSARPASTTRSGRPSPCCCRCAPSA